MAGINPIEPVAAQIKPVQGMSLGDMIGLARNVQAYQQAEQANPLALQKAQMEIEQAQQINPLASRKAAAEAATAEIGAKKSQLELDQSHFNLAGNILSGLESRAVALAKKGDKDTALKELNSAQSWISASGLPIKDGDVFTIAKKQLESGDFAGYLATLENQRNILGGAAARYQANLPQTATLAGAPAAFTPATGTAVPLNIGGQASGQGNGANVLLPNEKPQGVTPAQMSLPYPVRRAGDIRPFAPNEQQDQEIGLKYRASLADASSKMSTSLRNIDEVIKEAEKVGEEEWNKGAGFQGYLGRNLSTFLGTEQGVRYKRLSKDLANLQISMGADTSTDQGKQLVAAANGDATLPPDILQEIAHRTRADRENTMMQNQGAQIFAQKYGDANLRKFQKDWSDNAKDSRVFEAISIYNSDLPQKQKVEKINELFKGVSKEGMEKIKRQKANLERLSTTGEL